LQPVRILWYNPGQEYEGSSDQRGHSEQKEEGRKGGDIKVKTSETKDATGKVIKGWSFPEQKEKDQDPNTTQSSPVQFSSTTTFKPAFKMQFSIIAAISTALCLSQAVYGAPAAEVAALEQRAPALLCQLCSIGPVNSGPACCSLHVSQIWLIMIQLKVNID
jgi:hypothetical protein